MGRSRPGGADDGQSRVLHARRIDRAHRNGRWQAQRARPGAPRRARRGLRSRGEGSRAGAAHGTRGRVLGGLRSRRDEGWRTRGADDALPRLRARRAHPRLPLPRRRGLQRARARDGRVPPALRRLPRRRHRPLQARDERGRHRPRDAARASRSAVSDSRPPTSRARPRSPRPTRRSRVSRPASSIAW